MKFVYGKDYGFGSTTYLRLDYYEKSQMLDRLLKVMNYKYFYLLKGHNRRRLEVFRDELSSSKYYVEVDCVEVKYLENLEKRWGIRLSYEGNLFVKDPSAVQEVLPQRTESSKAESARLERLAEEELKTWNGKEPLVYCPF